MTNYVNHPSLIMSVSETFQTQGSLALISPNLKESQWNLPPQHTHTQIYIIWKENYPSWRPLSSSILFVLLYMMAMVQSDKYKSLIHRVYRYLLRKDKSPPKIYIAK